MIGSLFGRLLLCLWVVAVLPLAASAQNYRNTDYDDAYNQQRGYPGRGYSRNEDSGYGRDARYSDQGAYQGSPSYQPAPSGSYGSRPTRPPVVIGNPSHDRSGYGGSGYGNRSNYYYDPPAPQRSYGMGNDRGYGGYDQRQNEAWLDEPRPRVGLLRRLDRFLGNGLIYVGAGFGRTTYAQNSTLFTNDSTGRKLFFGFQLTPSTALEATYHDFGRFEGSFTTADGTYYNRATYQIKAYSLGVRGRLALDERWSLTGKVGLYKSQTTINGSSSVTTLDANQIENAFAYSVGTDWRVDNNWTMRLDFDYIGRQQTGKTRLWSLGAEYIVD